MKFLTTVILQNFMDSERHDSCCHGHTSTIFHSDEHLLGCFVVCRNYTRVSWINAHMRFTSLKFCIWILTAIMELCSLQAEVSLIRANTVTSTFRSAYRRSTVKFLIWLHDHRRELLSSACIDYLEDKPNRSDALLELLSSAPRTPPIMFDTITAADFLMWIVTLRKTDGSTPGYSSYNSHRAAFFNLFRDYEQTMSKRLESELSNHFKGLKRQTALQIAQGESEVKVGKDPLSFTLYRFLGLQLMIQNSRECVFARCFMVLCWNLMSRASNAFGIRYQHVEWREYALCIYFSHMKNDQAADRPRDPRHVYSNPLMPEICPILSLGMYWLCFPFGPRSTQLFPGSNQYDRFRKLLARCLAMHDVVIELVPAL
jgi:hypothetical protein